MRRYPPVEENFTNRGTGGNAAIQFEHEFSATDRIGLVLRRGETQFLVPNERVQAQAGQQQERSSHDTTADLPNELKEVNPDSVKFMIEHEAELTAMQKEMEQLGKPKN